MWKRFNLPAGCKAGINHINLQTGTDTAAFHVGAQPYGARQHFNLALRWR